jgi:hypothetical protein
MRREDLREGTKRAAERDSHKLKTRLSPGEKRNHKRMATVAAVYSIERQVRTPESVMGVKSEEDAPKPRARNKRVWASVERSSEQVTEEVFQEALRRDPKRERPWLMLVDGHEEQFGQIRAAIDRHGVEVTLVVNDRMDITGARWGMPVKRSRKTDASEWVWDSICLPST